MIRLRSGAARLARGVRRRLGSARTRIAVSYVILLVFATVVSVVLIRQLLIVNLDDRVQESLVQETEEFDQLVDGVNPETGKPFGPDLESLFDVYLGRNVPSEGEELLAIVGDTVYASDVTERASVFPLERDPELVRRWTALTRPESGEVDTPAGPVRYIAIPVRDGREVRGRFVVANFMAGEREEVDDAVQIAALVGAGVTLLGSAFAFVVAGRVLRPLKALTETARTITETDLTRRIRVEGNDELAELGQTFNAMLERLDAAFASQRSLVRDAGHELRTPITIVRGHLELLGDDPTERRETIELVTDELDRMSRFVDDLLLLAKAEQPDFLQLETVNLEALSKELIAKAEALAPRDWRLEASARGMVVADRQRLTQAVMNLAHNAVQQTRAGDLIALGAELNGTEARLWVRDAGPGVRAADQRRIFERFARGENGTRYAGTGLGLSIVRAIAEAHGGRVRLDSSPGQGARFTLVIPVDQRYDEVVG